MLVVKRDGRVVEWNRAKIEVAVQKAGADEITAEGVMKDVVFNLPDREQVTIEEIQDLVEISLMKHDPLSAKRYILYRNDRARARALNLKPDILALSDYIFASKYGRWIPELRRREVWAEAVERVMKMHQRRFPELSSEIERIFRDFVFTMRVLPSMRSLQFGGPAIEVNHSRMYNCSFTLMNRPRAFAEIFHLLLSGCGVGFSVQEHHVESLPPVLRPDKTNIIFHECEDTIEGWARALETLTYHAFTGGLWVEFEYRNIRPEGAWLKTSGGVAPGHVPLKDCLEAVRKILLSAVGRRLRPIEVHDIVCNIAMGVLSGGVRRSSLISLFSITDIEMLEAKTGDWLKHHPVRAMANNSVVFLRDNENFAQFERIFKMTREYGEPGIFFTHSKEFGTNPCGEIGLDPMDGFGFCNLTEINAATLDSGKDFIERAKAAAFIGTLQASYTDFPFIGRQKAPETERLLGVGITGVLDNPIAYSARWQQEAAKAAVEENRRVALRIGIAPAARVTTVKPSGTASLLLGVGSGIHPHHARRYIRRVTANRNEPPFKFFRAINPKMCVEKPNGDFVIEFPVQVRSDAIVIEDLTAEQFMEKVFSTYENWILPGTQSEKPLTHNVSCTVTVRDEEWEKIAFIVWNNRHRISAMSFLPHIGDKVYPFAPMEKIATASDEARWAEILQSYRPVDWKVAEEREDTTVKGSACEGPSCQI